MKLQKNKIIAVEIIFKFCEDTEATKILKVAIFIVLYLKSDINYGLMTSDFEEILFIHEKMKKYQYFHICNFSRVQKLQKLTKKFKSSYVFYF